MSKNIVFCADGTWNNSTEEDNHTNVYELFELLKGDLRTGCKITDHEQEKEYREPGGIVQVAKYIHGVGDYDSKVVSCLMGLTGGGTLTRIIRGYTFISRNYEKGDNIFITGFSRGAYTARALADFIAVKGLLRKSAMHDKEAGYRKGALAWYEYRENVTEAKGLTGFIDRLKSVKEKMVGFLTGDSIHKGDFVQVDNIAAVGVWDTVGKLGIPVFVNDPDGAGGTESYDAFRFCGKRLSSKVLHGFHALSLDDHRADFSPTVWEADTRIKQMVFPGAHSDVGGGYHEKGLSSVTLQWMVDELMASGLAIDEKAFGKITPDPAGTAHIPWKGLPYLTHDRTFDKIPGHCSIARRGGAGPVKPDPDEERMPYAPINLPTDVCTNPARKLCARCR